MAPFYLFITYDFLFPLSFQVLNLSPGYVKGIPLGTELIFIRVKIHSRTKKLILEKGEKTIVHPKFTNMTNFHMLSFKKLNSYSSSFFINEFYLIKRQKYHFIWIFYFLFFLLLILLCFSPYLFYFSFSKDREVNRKF